MRMLGSIYTIYAVLITLENENWVYKLEFFQTFSNPHRVKVYIKAQIFSKCFRIRILLEHPSCVEVSTVELKI